MFVTLPNINILISVVMRFYFQMKFHHSGIVCKCLKQGIGDYYDAKFDPHLCTKSPFFAPRLKRNGPTIPLRFIFNLNQTETQFESN